MPRHESQAVIIDKLQSLIATIESLPEETEVCSAEARTLGGTQIWLGSQSFADLFAGQVVERNEMVVTAVVDGCKFLGSLRGQLNPSGPYTMPAIEEATA